MTNHNFLKSDWDSCLDEYTAALGRNVRLDCDDGLPFAERLSQLLGMLLLYFVRNSKAKDEWSQLRWRSTSEGVFISTYSKKQKHEYTLGIYNQEIYLSSAISEAQNLKSMNDDFWHQFMLLSRAGDFQFQENAGLPDSVKRVCDTKSSRNSMFKLVRNFVLFEEHSPKNTTDLGWFEFKWHTSAPIETIQSSGTIAFKGIYKLNYLLYRSQYLKDKSRHAD